MRNLHGLEKSLGIQKGSLAYPVRGEGVMNRTFVISIWILVLNGVRFCPSVLYGRPLKFPGPIFHRKYQGISLPISNPRSILPTNPTIGPSGHRSRCLIQEDHRKEVNPGNLEFGYIRINKRNRLLGKISFDELNMKYKCLQCSFLYKSSSPRHPHFRHSSWLFHLPGLHDGLLPPRISFSSLNKKNTFSGEAKVGEFSNWLWLSEPRVIVKTTMIYEFSSG